MNVFKLNNSPFFVSYHDLVISLGNDLRCRIYDEFNIYCRFEDLLVKDNTLLLREEEDDYHHQTYTYKEITKDQKYVDLYNSIENLSRFTYNE